MRRIIFILCVSVQGVMLSSCGANKSNESAEQSANAFYTALQSGNVDDALKNCSQDAFATQTKEEWNKAISNNLGLLGQLKTYTKISGWNISTSTGTGTQVSVEYDVEYEHGKSKDSIVLIKDEDDIMRIIEYNWNFTEARYLEGIDESEKLASIYMDAVAEKNFELAYALCGYKATEVTSKEQWVSMLSGTSDAAGNMLKYTIDTGKSHCSIDAEGGAGRGNYYDVYIETESANGTIKETFTLYQPDYNEPIKIVAHSRE